LLELDRLQLELVRQFRIASGCLTRRPLSRSRSAGEHGDGDRGEEKHCERDQVFRARRVQ